MQRQYHNPAARYVTSKPYTLQATYNAEYDDKGVLQYRLVDATIRQTRVDQGEEPARVSVDLQDMMLEILVEYGTLDLPAGTYTNQQFPAKDTSDLTAFAEQSQVSVDLQDMTLEVLIEHSTLDMPSGQYTNTEHPEKNKSLKSHSEQASVSVDLQDMSLDVVVEYSTYDHTPWPEKTDISVDLQDMNLESV